VSSDGARNASCALPTYLSWGIDGDDGPWVVRAECDGPRGCGWSQTVEENVVPLAGGINSEEWAALEAAHRATARGDSREVRDGA
jgi:hypothetical protein